MRQRDTRSNKYAQPTPQNQPSFTCDAMADVRALLKQKRQQAAPRITHPLAQYTPNNQLQCKACNIPVKEFMWEGHVGSKKHRMAVARLREEQARAEAARAAEQAQEEEEDLDFQGCCLRLEIGFEWQAQ